MKISIGSDHGGFVLKENVKKHLLDLKYDVIDCGCNSLDSVDYPVYAEKVCEKVQSHECEFGVLVCTSGIGMSICANKYDGIRAALVLNEDASKYSRMHNNCNVICLGAKYMNEDEANHYVDNFLNTLFEGGRHSRRVEMIDNIIKTQIEKEK